MSFAEHYEALKQMERDAALGAAIRVAAVELFGNANVDALIQSLKSGMLKSIREDDSELDSNNKVLRNILLHTSDSPMARSRHVSIQSFWDGAPVDWVFTFDVDADTSPHFEDSESWIGVVGPDGQALIATPVDIRYNPGVLFRHLYSVLCGPRPLPANILAALQMLGDDQTWDDAVRGGGNTRGGRRRGRR